MPNREKSNKATAKDNQMYILYNENRDLSVGQITIDKCVNSGDSCKKDLAFQCRDDFMYRSLLSGENIETAVKRDFAFPNGCKCEPKEIISR